MTLIVMCISDEYAIVASDRRITWLDKDGHPVRREDTENKAIVLCGHFLMGYTGFARLDDVKTEQWVGDALSGVDVSQYFATLAQRSQSAVAKIRRETGLEIDNCGHAFVAAGYGSFRSAPDRLQAVGVTVSNALSDSYGSWQPRDDFKVTRTPPLSGKRDFRIGVFGATPVRSVLSEAVELIRRYRKHDVSRVLGICQIMVNVIRTTADDNEGVGKDISVSVLPRSGVPALDVSVPMAGVRDPVTNLTCAFVPSNEDIEHAFAYVPAAVCPGMARFGGEVWTSKPPWWKD